MAWSVALCRRSSSVPATAKAIPRGDAWLQEPKLDGYRLQVKLNSRNSHEWTQRLAALAEALQAIPRRSVVLDLSYALRVLMAHLISRGCGRLSVLAEKVSLPHSRSPSFTETARFDALRQLM